MACVFFGNDSKRSGAGIACSIHGENKEDVALEWLIRCVDTLFLIRFRFKDFVLLGTASCFADTNMCKTSCVKDPSASCKYKICLFNLPMRLFFYVCLHSWWRPVNIK